MISTEIGIENATDGSTNASRLSYRPILTIM